MGMEPITSIIAALLAVIALLIVVIRWALDNRKTISKEDVSQSKLCGEQHVKIITNQETIINELREIRRIAAKE